MGDPVGAAADVSTDRITLVLDAAAAGEAGAAERLLPLVYEQLRAPARRRMSEERAGHTLEATALVHEAYLRLVGSAAEGSPKWSGRGHFYCAAAEAMRRMLVEHARARGRIKRGGDRERLTLQSLTSVTRASECDGDDIIALDSAFQELERVNPDAAAVVRLR